MDFIQVEEEEDADQVVKGEEDDGEDSEKDSGNTADDEGAVAAKVTPVMGPMGQPSFHRLNIPNICFPLAQGPVGESVLMEDGDVDLAALVASGVVQTHYAGPTPRQMLRWRRNGKQW